ncbi:unnamed protein product [Darwinula stevensoni]|uniref:Ribonuclease P protein subunit p29 n=1 Tax=Darwinula stevensoni TaxID=69355 RepID=A0A7R9A825_9CRUS|nr:unnamed protein product [Darwinula stevensoni]CAG0894701.1 unnamed protein product [Darwinula stevensoni]
MNVEEAPKDPLLSPLPSLLKDVLTPLGQKLVLRSQTRSREAPFAEKYLRHFLPVTDQSGLKEGLHSGFVLGNVRLDRPKQQPRVRRKQLSARERRRLGIHRLDAKNRRFSEFLPLHRLWQGYMREFLGLEGLKQQGWECKHWEGPHARLLTKLCRADYHGCLLKVTASRCPSLIGICGIVVKETRNSFLIMERSNTIKTLLKDGSHFGFLLDGYFFTLYGTALLMRPADRSTRKFKINKNTVQL